MTTEQPLTQFDHLLNAYTHAAQSDKPADHGYRDKRRALYAYVRDLERITSESVPAQPVDEALIERIAQQWDGCMYDAPGDAIDIGAAIRAAALSRKGQE